MTNIYEIVRSDRKTIAIQVKDGGRVIVRAPQNMCNADIRKFVESNRGWIEKHLEIVRQRDENNEPVSVEELKKLAEQAVKDIPKRAAYYAAHMGISYGRITIRAQKTCWGSCSAQGNLNFNCLLMLCPEEVRDYVVVHELCHRKELNHSERFWREVASVMPDYAERRKWLKEKGDALIRRLHAEP